jgi:hypothetical protein
MKKYHMKVCKTKYGDEYVALKSYLDSKVRILYMTRCNFFIRLFILGKHVVDLSSRVLTNTTKWLQLDDTEELDFSPLRQLLLAATLAPHKVKLTTNTIVAIFSISFSWQNVHVHW